MKKILVVEDSKIALKILVNIISVESIFEPVYASSYKEALDIYEKEKADIFAALIDYHLPDSDDGELVDFLLTQNVPTIVLTGSFNESLRKNLLNKGIVDYVIKEGKFSYQYAVKLLNRIYKNQNTHVLVVEDSDTARRYIAELLELYLFKVHTAVDGLDALQKLDENPGVKMVITDYNMPNMDGFELIQKLRNNRQAHDLVIIGLSGDGKESLSAKFIKNGANDFLLKPFNREEFQCRVLHNVESQEYLEHIRNTANRDFLTNSYNRRYFFKTGSQLYEKAKANQQALAVAVIDIDHFKKINDTYGHDVGDQILKLFARQLNGMLERFLVARAGGEEFFVMMPGLNNAQACKLLDEVRGIIANSSIDTEQGPVKATFSAGISNQYAESLDAQIKAADLSLYEAKESGRNCVLGDKLTSDCEAG